MSSISVAAAGNVTEGEGPAGVAAAAGNDIEGEGLAGDALTIAAALAAEAVSKTGAPNVPVELPLGAGRATAGHGTDAGYAVGGGVKASGAGRVGVDKAVLSSPNCSVGIRRKPGSINDTKDRGLVPVLTPSNPSNNFC